MYHIPAAGSPDFVPLDLATVILSDTPSGRLYHALVATKLASGVFESGHRRAGPDQHAGNAGQEALHATGTGSRAQQMADGMGTDL
ncbi:hypothetical protein G6F63_016332 [Rhizopus arrhizus]|nr:hypothetical protein G6F63_016332 [Rhizopus arrhizus]